MRALCAAMVGVALAAAAVSGSSAGAKSTESFCHKAVRTDAGAVDARINGVTVWHRGLVYKACTDRFRRSYGLLIADRGVRAARVKASNKRCVAILFTAKGKLPRILFKDLAATRAGSSIQTVGFGNPSASVGSLAVATNCAAAWGQTVTSAAGTSTNSIAARGFGAATSVPTAVNEVALVPTAADTEGVGIAAAGRGVTVTWTEGGTRQAVALP